MSVTPGKRKIKTPNSAELLRLSARKKYEHVKDSPTKDLLVQFEVKRLERELEDEFLSAVSTQPNTEELLEKLREPVLSPEIMSGSSGSLTSGKETLSRGDMTDDSTPSLFTPVSATGSSTSSYGGYGGYGRYGSKKYMYRLEERAVTAEVIAQYYKEQNRKLRAKLRYKF